MGGHKEYPGTDFNGFYRFFSKEKTYLASARPTAVNLSWALERMDRVCLAGKSESVEAIKKSCTTNAFESARRMSPSVVPSENTV